MMYNLARVCGTVAVDFKNASRGIMSLVLQCILKCNGMPYAL